MLRSNKTSKIFNVISFSYLAYVVILFYVAIQYFPTAFKTSYNGLLFPAELNLFRLITSPLFYEFGDHAEDVVVRFFGYDNFGNELFFSHFPFRSTL